MASYDPSYEVWGMMTSDRVTWTWGGERLTLDIPAGAHDEPGDAVRLVRELEGHVKNGGHMEALVVATGSLGLSLDFRLRTVDWLAKRRDRIRIAIVAPERTDNELVPVLARLTRSEMRVFATREEGESWLAAQGRPIRRGLPSP